MAMMSVPMPENREAWTNLRWGWPNADLRAPTALGTTPGRNANLINPLPLGALSGFPGPRCRPDPENFRCPAGLQAMLPNHVGSTISKSSTWILSPPPPVSNAKPSFLIWR